MRERRLVKATGKAPCARCDGPFAKGDEAVFRVGGIIHLACDEMMTTTMASIVLGISVGRLRRVVKRHGIQPDGTQVNSHYKTGPYVALWHASTVVGTLRDLVPAPVATKEIVDARSALWLPIWAWARGLEHSGLLDRDADPMRLVAAAESAGILLPDEAAFLRGTSNASEVTRASNSEQRA